MKAKTVSKIKTIRVHDMLRDECVGLEGYIITVLIS